MPRRKRRKQQERQRKECPPYLARRGGFSFMRRCCWPRRSAWRKLRRHHDQTRRSWSPISTSELSNIWTGVKTRSAKRHHPRTRPRRSLQLGANLQTKYGFRGQALNKANFLLPKLLNIFVSKLPPR